MRRRNILKTNESFIAIDAELPLKKSPRGGSGEPLVCVVGVDQETFVGEGVGAHKFVTVRGGVHFEMTAGHPMGDQACGLRARKSGHVLEIRTDQAAVFFLKGSVTKPLERFCDPSVFVESRETFEDEATG